MSPDYFVTYVTGRTTENIVVIPSDRCGCMRFSMKFSGLNRGLLGSALIYFIVSCSSLKLRTNESSTQSGAERDISAWNSRGGDFLAKADAAERQLIEDLGPQQTFLRAGWPQNQNYQPPQDCFGYWLEEGDQAPQESEVGVCAAQASGLSRFYDSHGTDAEPIIFKSRYYWAWLNSFQVEFPRLVEAWKDIGGCQDDPSFLYHPVCAEPLQEGWEGSDYFYDGAEHPLCKLFKIDQAGATQ